MLRFLQKNLVFRISEYEELKARLMKFPFSRMHQKVKPVPLPEPGSDFLSQDIIEDAIAFTSLKQFNQGSLKVYYERLFQERAPEELEGTQIYSKYFITKISVIKRAISQGKDKEEINYYLKALIYLSLDPMVDVDSFGIDFDKIESSGTLEQKSYLLHFYSQKQSFIPFVEEFYKQFSNSGPKDQLDASMVVVSLPNYHKILPTNLTSLCIEKIITNIGKMDDWELYNVIQFVYGVRLPSTKKLLDAIASQVVGRFQSQSQLSKVPMVIKLIKARQKEEMDNSMFENFISSNQLKFNTIFFKKNVKKDNFLDALATKNSLRILPDEMRESFSQYVLKVINEASNAEQFREEELIEALKLASKFQKNLSPSQKSSIQLSLREKILPMYVDSTSIIFWSFMLLIKFDPNALTSEKQINICYNLLDSLDSQYGAALTPTKQRDILQQILDIWYQIVRKNIPTRQRQLSNLSKYNFKRVKSIFKINYACYLICKVDIDEELKKKMAKSMLPRAEDILEKGEIKAIKYLYTFIKGFNVLSEFKPRDQTDRSDLGQNRKREEANTLTFFYIKLEKVFVDLIKNAKEPPSSEDCKYMKKFYRMNAPNHTHLSRLLDNLIDHPSGFKKHVDEYLQIMKNKSRS